MATPSGNHGGADVIGRYQSIQVLYREEGAATECRPYKSQRASDIKRSLFSRIVDD